MTTATKPYYGERLAGDRADEAAYVLARMRFLLIGSPEPTLKGWGVSNTRPQRKAALDAVADTLIAAAKTEAAS